MTPTPVQLTPLAAQLRELRSLLRQSASPASREQLELWRRYIDLVRRYPPELAESRASDKQLVFQRRFMDRRDADGRKLNIFVAMGANRSGKSIVAGHLCFAKYLRDVARKGDWFWCVGQTLDRSIGGQQKELWNGLPRRMFDRAWDEKIGFGAHRKITLPTSDGGRCLVEFRSADQAASTFEQAKLAGVWIDERCPEEVFDRLLARIIDRDGFILYSDIPEQWWQYQRLANAAPEAGVYFTHMVMEDNAHNLPAGAIAQAAAIMSEDERRKRIHGLFTVLEGIVYKQYDDVGHVCRPFKIPRRWPKWRLIDYGSSAPTACLWVAIGDDERRYVYREHYTRGMSVQRNAEMILAASGDEEYVCTYMDPHAIDSPPAIYGIADTVSDQYRAAGIPSKGWPYVQTLGEHAMVETVKRVLEADLLRVFEPCINTRREFRSWKYKCDKEGKVLAADAYENDNNHTLDAYKGFEGTKPVFNVPRTKVVA